MNEKVLLIEDDDVVLRSLSKLLHKFGFEVIRARRLSEAMDAFTTHTDIWAVLVDGSVGADTPHTLNTLGLIESFRRNRRVRIVAMASDPNHRDEQLQAGANFARPKDHAPDLLRELRAEEQAGR